MALTEREQQLVRMATLKVLAVSLDEEHIDTTPVDLLIVALDGPISEEDQDAVGDVIESTTEEVCKLLDL